MKKLKARDRWAADPDDGLVALSEDDRSEITDLLVGRRVVEVDDDHLLLDDGTVIKAIGNDGGCACSAGCYDLSVLSRVDNIITKVEFDYHPAGDGDPYDGPNEAKQCDPSQDEYSGHYRIFVFAGDERINLMQFDGTDGNGYYGTGFDLLVSKAVSR